MTLVTLRKAILSGVCVTALGASGALAGGLGLHEQSAEALGESFSGVAAGAGGLSSMFWNPATITKSPGIQTSSSYSLIMPYASDTLVAAPVNPAGLPSPGNTVGTALVPASYASYQLSDQWWVGVSVNTPFGSSTKNPYGSIAGPWGLSTTVFTMDVTPELAFKVNDWISFGLGVQAMYLEARETLATGLTPTPGVAILKGSSWGFGVTAGVTITPMDGTEFGIGYRSQVRQELSGTFVGVPGAPASFSVGAPLTLPDSISAGIRQRITPQFTLLGGVEWTNWSKLQNLVVTSTNPAVPFTTTQVLAYRDGWMFSLGGEYKWDQNLTLRAGAAYEISPVTNSNRDVRLLDSDRVWVSLGASYQVSSRIKLDLSYAHVFYQDGTIFRPAPTGFPGAATYSGASSARGDIVAVGFTYRWDEPAAKALVAKY